MNNFEFLRMLPMGQYIPGRTVVHCLDARAKIISTMLLVVAIIFAGRMIGLLIALFVVVLLLMLARIPLGYALRGLVAPLPFLILLAVIQFFLNSQPDSPEVIAEFGRLTLSLNDVWVAMTLLLRFAVLVLLLGLASFVISNSEMIHGTESLLSPLRRVGIPVEDFVMTIQVMLRFLPFLVLEAERIAKAQAARGAEWGTRKGGLIRRVRQVLPLLVPLFIISLLKANNLALAMYARGYGTTPRRTVMTSFQFRWLDGIAILCAVVISAGILFG